MVAPLRQPKTVDLDAALACAALAKGTAYLKCVWLGRGFRYVKRWGRTGQAAKSSQIKNVNHEFWLFTPGTQSEKDAFRAAKAFQRIKNRSWLYVSAPCSGACAGLPVVLPFGDRRSGECLTEDEKVGLWKLYQGIGGLDRDTLENLDELGFVAQKPDGEWALRVRGIEAYNEIWGVEVPR